MAWDGTYNGNPSPPGTYFYTIEIGDTTGKEKSVMTGYITLMR
jgi:gliding motility-associated-like protein